MVVKRDIHVLIIESSEVDFLSVLMELERGGFNTTAQRVDTRETLKEAFENGPWDVVICDYRLPEIDVIEVLTVYKDMGLDMPFIIVSGAVGEDKAVNAMKAGAHDYVMKANLSRLVPAVKRELNEAMMRRERRQVAEALYQSEEKYRRILESIDDAYFESDLAGSLTFFNRSLVRFLGYSRSELAGMSFNSILDDANHNKLQGAFRKAVEAAEPIRLLRCEFRNKESAPVYGELSASLMADESGRPLGFRGIIRDVTSRHKMEIALSESEKKYRNIFENATEGIFQSSREKRFLDVNPSLAKIMGYDSPGDMIAGISDISRQLYVTSSDRRRINRMLRDRQSVVGYETQFYKKDRSVMWGSLTVRAVCDQDDNLACYEGTVLEITKRKQAEEQERKVVESLKKAMRAIIQTLSMTVEIRDPYTSGHQQRVANLARAIAEEMGLEVIIIDSIAMAALIHDIGKISIPAEILSKPTKLSDIEYDLIKAHSPIGYDILKDMEFPWPIARIIYQHHERLDGSGYPLGLKGDDILLEAKVLALADVVEAMSSHRPYRPTLGLDKALDEISQKRGMAYDPAVVDACFRLFQEKSYHIS
jgi:PAS domain S-box-containing protein/putative nucleotidyltransferase with HDIG domain